MKRDLGLRRRTTFVTLTTRWAAASILALGGLGPWVRPAAAQFSQYTPPGSLGVGTVSSKQAMEKSVGNAPWKLGPFRFQPYVGVKDIGYVQNMSSNSGAIIDDYTATLGLGLKGYLPMGPKLVFAAHYLPEYTWWKESEDLRGWHMRSGLGMFAYFNRLTVEVKTTATDLLDYVSSEFDSPATLERVGLGLDAHAELHGPWGVYFGATYLDAAYDDEGVENVFDGQLALLDRKEQSARAGVSYTLSNGFRVAAGGAWSEVDFDNAVRDRSNDGFGQFVTVSHDGRRWSAGVDLTRYELEPLDGSEFVPYDQIGGGARVTWRGRRRIGITGYGGRNVVFSLAEGSSHFTDERVGASIDSLFGWRTQARAFVEVGQNDYEPLSGSLMRRQDDYLGYGADVQLKITENTTCVLGFSRQEYESSAPGFDRKITTIRINLNLGSGLLSPW